LPTPSPPARGRERAESSGEDAVSDRDLHLPGDGGRHPCAGDPRLARAAVTSGPSLGAALSRSSDEAEPVSRGSGLCAVRDPELAVDVVEVKLHRLVGEVELLSNRAVGKSARDGFEDLQLALGQPGPVAHLLLSALVPATLQGASDARGQREVD